MATHAFLFVLDDWGPGSWGEGGHETIQTPRMDALANAGRRFDNFCAVAPVCSPSRAGYWTGRHPQFSGVHYTDGPTWTNRYHVPEGMPTYASLLQAAGVTTAHFGKTNLGYPPRCGYPQRYGHDFWAGIITAQHHTDFYWMPEGKRPLVHSNTSGVGPDDRFYAALESWIENHTDEPTMAAVWGVWPHEPLGTITFEEESQYSGETLQLRKHYAAITHVDSLIGSLVDKLTALGILSDSRIIIVSDQGPEPDNGGSTGGLRGWKTHLTEGGVRVPCIYYGPEVTAGTVDTDPRNGLDLLPTFLDIFGVDHSAFDGVPLHDTPPTRTLFAEYHGPTRSPKEGGSATAKRDDLKMHYDEGGGGGYTLYDLSSDPTESTDIYDAGTTAHTDLRDELIAWRATLPVESPTGSSTSDDEDHTVAPPEPQHLPKVADGDIGALINKLLDLPATGGTCSHGDPLPDRDAWPTSTDTHPTLGHTGTVVHDGLIEAAQDPTNRARLTSGELETLDAALAGAVAYPADHTSLP